MANFIPVYVPAGSVSLVKLTADVSLTCTTKGPGKSNLELLSSMEMNGMALLVSTVTVSMSLSNCIFAKTTIALSIRIESIPAVVPLAFAKPTGVPGFENATDIVVFPGVEEESGFVDFMQPNKRNAINRKPMIFREVIVCSFFTAMVIWRAGKIFKNELILHKQTLEDE